jgi:ATP-dependent protease HslVU (ClpYQ) peptidase subunit
LTVIAAARTARSVTIGCDSIATSEDGVQGDVGTKLVEFPWGAVGSTGGIRPLQVAEEALADLDAVETKRQALALVRALRGALVAAGWRGASSSRMPELPDLTLLIIGRRGAIWTVQSDLSLIRSRKYAAVGSGEAVALGAMHALHRSSSSPVLVEAAVRAAIAHQSDCGGRLHRVEYRIK